jgi:pyridoxamine 5'-phosphate oxidase family protein
MTFTDPEIDYLTGQPIGRLATKQPNGNLQVNPVVFAYNTDTGTIDIGGYTMSASRKYRNVADNGRVAFVLDDVVSTDPWRVRFLEVRGRAEAIPEPTDSASRVSGAIIRIHPERIISFALDTPDLEPHQVQVHSRAVPAT